MDRMNLKECLEIVIELADMGLEADTLALVGRDHSDDFEETTEAMKERQKTAITRIKDYVKYGKGHVSQ